MAASVILILTSVLMCVTGEECGLFSTCCDTEEGDTLFRCSCPDVTCLELGDAFGRFIIAPSIVMLRASDCTLVHVLEGSDFCGKANFFLINRTSRFIKKKIIQTHHAQ